MLPFPDLALVSFARCYSILHVHIQVCLKHGRLVPEKLNFFVGEYTVAAVAEKHAT